MISVEIDQPALGSRRARYLKLSNRRFLEVVASPPSSSFSNYVRSPDRRALFTTVINYTVKKGIQHRHSKYNIFAPTDMLTRDLEVKLKSATVWTPCATATTTTGNERASERAVLISICPGLLIKYVARSCLSGGFLSRRHPLHKYSRAPFVRNANCRTSENENVDVKR